MNIASLVQSGAYRSLRAAVEIEPDTILFRLTGSVVAAPSRHSIQISQDRHLLPKPGVEREYQWQYMNHACDPNVAVDLAQMAFVSRRAIRVGEELAFNYNTTEWDMAEPFVCICGCANCTHLVSGFLHLDMESQAGLLPHCTEHIRQLYEMMVCCVDI
ncbi:MAG TPA: SET domain-containing protein [Spirochaetia bacterium]|nr:SET domain-containing protein [Spirochaetia bacterium]